MVTDRRLLLAAALLRALAMGMIGPLLGFYLAGLSFDDATIGAILSAGLAGAAAATAWITFLGDTVPRRLALVTIAVLCLGGGAVAALATGPWIVGAGAFVGMLNGMGRDRGASLVIEQAMLPETANPAGRTTVFAWYSAVQDVGAALGGLCSGIPAVLRHEAGLDALPALRVSVGAYLAILLLGALPYLFLSRGIAGQPLRSTHRVSAETRRILLRLCALFAIDSIAGGFLTSSFLALFFRRQFGAGEATIALLFFGRNVLNAASHLGAAWLARRIGLVNTMVFTHIPSSVLLATVTVAPTFTVAAVLFLLREGLVEMDVPTRASYVMAVVRPEERTSASGAAHLVRMGGWAVAPAIAGLLSKSASSLAPALWIGAALKITYDVLLWVAFRRVKPPEEAR
jgi:MFS family permease